MLLELAVKNVGLIEHMQLSCKQGLHVLTGETGAGKSMIIGALTVAVGGRASQELIRYGTDAAHIEAVFAVPDFLVTWFDGYGIDVGEEQELIVSREVKLQGKSVCRLNGRLVPVHLLKEIMAPMVDIHGQHEHQKLLDTKEHLQMLDNYGKKKLEPVLVTVQDLYKEYSNAKKRYRELADNERDMAQRIEFLQFQVQELQEARLKSGEEEELEVKKKRLANQEKIAKNMQLITTYLTGGDQTNNSVNSLLHTAITRMQELGKMDPKFQKYIEILESANIQVEDVAREINAAIEFDVDEEDINGIESRLYQLQQIKRKYRMEIDSLIEYKQTMEQELYSLKNRDTLLLQYEQQMESARNKYQEAADQLSSRRRQIALTMEKHLKEELTQLSFPMVQFQIQFQKSNEPRENGQDQIEFLFSANKGEPLRPLVKVASGGELSRIMLALKNLMADLDKTPTLIFDEVDTGVSGIAAQKIAEKLAAISRNRQTFCITHLPQIAAMGDVHLFIEKQASQQKTVTNVTILDEQQMVEELGRMISGNQITDKTREHAQELKQFALKFKKIF